MTLPALRFLTVLLPAVLLDLILGDPRWLPHPVRWMGRTISALEPFHDSFINVFRKTCRNASCQHQHISIFQLINLLKHLFQFIIMNDWSLSVNLAFLI